MERPQTETTIHISIASVVKVVLTLALLYAAFIIRDIVFIILMAVVIASAVEPATRWFKKYRIPRLPAVIIVFFVTVATIFSIFYFMLPPLLSDTASFLGRAPEYLRSINLNSLFGGAPLSSQALQSFGGGFTAQDLLSGFQSYLVNIPGGVFTSVSTVFGGVFSFVMIIVISFYLAVQEEGVARFLEIVTPYRHQKYVVGLWKRTQHKIGQWMQGQLLLMLIVAVLVYLGLVILGVKHALLFAIVAGLLEIIPIFGPVLASIPAIATSFTDGGATTGFIVVGLYIIVQQFENHLIYPLVVNRVVGIPALLVIIGVIVGWDLAGFLGVLLSVPVAVVLMELTADIQRKNKMLAELENSPSV